MIARSSRQLATRLLIAFVLAVAAGMPLPLSPFVGHADAQEVREHRSILELLFHSSKPKVVNKQPTEIRVKRKKRRPPTMTSNSAVTDAEAEIAKKPDARKVLVIGDFMAAALSDGLTMATSGDPNIVVEKGTDGSSGLVRTDHLDWPAALKKQIDEIKPSLIVIMLGSNDRQQISINGHKEKFRSEAWNTEYDRRIVALIHVAVENKIPFIWAGLPSFQSPSLSADAATLNNLYRAKVEAAGGVFIDIWDGFADEEGKFVASGSDINGQPVRLRGSDGLSLTKAGKRKMAFYLEKDIRRLIGADAATLSMLKLDETGNTPADAKATAPTYADIVAVPPMSLTDPELDGGNQLLDGNLMPKASGRSPRDLLIDKGETADAPEGRIDDFKWKPAAKPAG